MMKGKKMDGEGKMSHYDDPGPKMAEDKMLYGSTGPDGDNGNAMMMDKSCCNPGNPSTTGNGQGHWSHK